MQLPAPPVIRAFGGVTAVGPTGRMIDLGGPKQRAVMAVLLLEPNRGVSLDRLAARLWADDPPPRPEVSVRGYVSNLRKALAAAGLVADTVIGFRDGGYVLRLSPDIIDLHQFDELVDAGLRHTRLGDLHAARTCLRRALDLSTAPAFGPMAEQFGLTAVATRYDERRAGAVEALAAVHLDAGEPAQAAALLAAEIVRFPYRERARALHALALYRNGRAVDALRVIDQTRRLLADEIGVEPGPELRDLEAAILAHDDEVLGWRPPARPSSDKREPVAPLSHFGRADETSRVRQLLERLPARGGVLVVSGEAGIGKSTLLADLRAEAGRMGIVVGWARCPESAAAAPYHSWQTAARTLLPGGELRPQERRPDEEPAGARLATHVRELERLRDRGEPAVVVLDDLQWADDATLPLLEFLAPELEHLRILLAVGVRRSGGADIRAAVGDCLVELGRTSEPVHLTLHGLAADDIATWAAALAATDVSPALVQFLTATTGGNPFFVRELLALLGADGRLAGPFDPSIPTSVPPAVHDVVRRRMSRLPPETQGLLSLAAMIGNRFDLDLLAGVADLDLPHVLARLEPALDDGVVHADDASAGRFTFSHALVSNALAAEQNAARRAAHHARITDALELLRAADPDPWIEQLAYHAAEGLLAGTAPKALRYALRAAAAAEAAQSAADAALQLRRAIAAADAMPGFPSRQRGEMLRRLGVALRDSGDVTGRATLVEAARLAGVHGDTDELADILGELDTESLWAGYDWNLYDHRVVAHVERARSEPGLSARAQAQLTMALAAELVYLDRERSAELFAEAHRLADGLDDAVLSARVLLEWFWSVSGPSGLASRAAIGDQLAALDERRTLPMRLRPLAHLAQVSAALERCDADVARRCVDRARALAHPVRSPTGWAHLQFAEAGLALLDGDLAGAAAHAEALRPALQRVRRYTADSSPASILAVVHTEAGRYDEALACLDVLTGSPYAAPIHWLRAWVLTEAGRVDDARAALAMFDGPLPDDWLLLPLTTAAVHAAAAVGDRRFLHRHLPTLAPFADRFAFVGEGGLCLGPPALAIAAAQAALGDAQEARASGERALMLAERMGAVLWVRRSERLLARLRAT